LKNFNNENILFFKLFFLDKIEFSFLLIYNLFLDLFNLIIYLTL
jgi:hypothetical protein